MQDAPRQCTPRCAVWQMRDIHKDVTLILYGAHIDMRTTSRLGGTCDRHTTGEEINQTIEHCRHIDLLAANLPYDSGVPDCHTHALESDGITVSHSISPQNIGAIRYHAHRAGDSQLPVYAGLHGRAGNAIDPAYTMVGI